MNTLKTGFVVVILLGVLYGVYVTVNRPQPHETAEEDWAAPPALDIETGQPYDPSAPGDAAPYDPTVPYVPEGAPYVPEGGAYDPSGAATAAPGVPGFAPLPPPSYESAPHGRATASASDLPSAEPYDPRGLADASDAYPATPDGSPTGPPPSASFVDGSADSAASYPATESEAYPDAAAYAAAADPTGVSAAPYDPASDPGAWSPDAATAAVGDADSSEPSAASPAPEAADRSAAGDAAALADVWRRASALMEADQPREALALLTVHYDSPDLSPEQQEWLASWLDVLAGRVVYGTEHLLEGPYVVQAGESLESIAEAHQVSPELLFNINRGAIPDPQNLAAGTVLKVVRGPFRAIVDLPRQKTTLFLNDLYAGRFALTTGDQAPAPGKYVVQQKAEGQAWYGANGESLPPQHPDNPYGDCYLDLGGQVGLHGASRSGANAGRGCLSLDPTDARDVFSILARGSKVEVVR